MVKGLKKYRNIKLRCICQYFDEKLFGDLFDEVINLTFLKNNQKWNILSRVERRISERVPFYDWKVQKLLKRHETDIFHCLAEPYNLPALINKYSKNKTILDAQDFSGISTGIENLPKQTRDLERYCLENTDGIVHKGPKYEIEFYRKHGYKIDCPELTYLDYCDEDLFMPINSRKLSDDDNELHLVFTGGITSDPKLRFKYYIPFAKTLAKQKIHFHIYHNPYGIISLKPYIELDKKEKYFHLHKSVPYIELSKEIAKYDYGLWYHYPMVSDSVSPMKRKVAIGNKLSSYLEAGLPVIIGDHTEYGKKIIEKFKIGFAINEQSLDSFNSIVKKYELRKLCENIAIARKEISIKENIARLVTFYNRLMEED
jgi:hypothetical protein